MAEYAAEIVATPTGAAFPDRDAVPAGDTVPTGDTLPTGDEDDSEFKRAEEADKSAFPMDVRMALQPVVDGSNGMIVLHEALVRAPNGKSAAPVMRQLTPFNRRAFDQKCQRTTLDLVARLKLERPVMINILPDAIEDPDRDLETLAWLADDLDIAPEHIVLEINEASTQAGIAHLKRICRNSRRMGMKSAIDGFGAGMGGLSRLAALRPSFLKLDQSLVRGLGGDNRRRAIVASVVGMALDLGAEVIGASVETETEAAALSDCGVDLLQGNLVAEPCLESAATEADLALPRAE
ncbi:MAG: EAL domain-containing protein [Pseudomonadota bacterium]